MTKFDPLICHERFLNAETAIHDLLLCARQGDPQILP
ncbi:transposition helper protein, partial [Pseudomonas sp. ATCC 13867]